MNRDFLFSLEGKQFLLIEYERDCKSTHAIARDRGTHPNMVRRALLHHGIHLRSREAAQQEALRSGRHAHPTRGRKHSPATRAKIGEAVKRAWDATGAAERGRRYLELKAAWEAVSPERRAAVLAAAREAARKAARCGSRLYRDIIVALRASGFEVLARTEEPGLAADLLLPARTVAIRVDGPAHFLPIWGEERLAATAEADAAETASLLERGFKVLRIIHKEGPLTGVRIRTLLTKLIGMLDLELPNHTELEV